MNKKLFVTTAATSALLFAASTLPAYALLGSKLGVNVNASTTVSVQIDTAAKTRADAQIDARVKTLTALMTRVDGMARVTVSQQTSLKATIQSAIADMTTLKAKIDADTDNVALKADIQLITKSYRIYMLVMPEANIMAAADRIITTADTLTELSAKLKVRIDAAAASGANVTALTASLADMNAKIADAKVQANAAISEVTVLKPDNGDKTVFASNLAAMKDARSKIRAGIQDLSAARRSAGGMVGKVTSMKAKASAGINASSSARSTKD